jgi:hypothetical protein
MPHTAGSTKEHQFYGNRNSFIYGNSSAVAQINVHIKKPWIHSGSTLMKTSWVWFVGQRCSSELHGLSHARQKSKWLCFPPLSARAFQT